MAETTDVTETDIADNKKEKEKAKGGFKFFSIFTIPVLIGLMTLCLSLMGYGRDLGYLAEFDLSPQQLQRTPMDFLLRGVYGIFGLLDFDNKYLGAMFTLDVAERAWWLTLPMTAGLSMTAMICILLGWRLMPRSVRVRDLHNPVRPWWGHRALSRFRSEELRDARFRAYFYGSPFVIGISIPALFIVAGLAIWVLLTLFLMPYVLVPLKPAKMGQEAARSEVILPRECRSLGQGNGGAHCIRIFRNGCELARGRLIDQSVNRIWLFHKTDRSVSSVPLDGNLTEDVGTEVVPTPEPRCLQPADSMKASAVLHSN
jgi:hypothetical protein